MPVSPEFYILEGLPSDLLTSDVVGVRRIKVEGLGGAGGLDEKVPDLSGAWGYLSGTNGSVAVTASKRVLQITASATNLSAASLTIDGGQSVIIPRGKNVTIEPKANLVAPVIVFTDTDAYFIEYVE